jgi:hypothetical protein
VWLCWAGEQARVKSAGLTVYNGGFDGRPPALDGWRTPARRAASMQSGRATP